MSTEIAPSEVMAFRATEEPMLIKESKAETVSETATAGRGMFQPGETLESQVWPGSPASRAKDQICREAAATSVRAHEESMTMIIAVMTFVPA